MGKGVGKEGSFKLNNKWETGKVHFVLPELPIEMQHVEGILPLNIALDPKLGSETVLLLFDRTPFIYELAKVNPFRLHLHTGLANTSHGPIGFFVFFVPDPNNGKEPFISIDCHVNPFDPQHLLIWRDLARQSHWHLVLVDKENTVVKVSEFNNHFKLNDTLDQMEEACRNMDSGAFDAAKQELCSKYTPDDLLSL